MEPFLNLPYDSKVKEVWLLAARCARTTGILLLATFGALVFVPEEHRLVVLKTFDLLLLFAVVWVLCAVLIIFKLRSSIPKGLFLILLLFIVTPSALWLLGIRWDLFVQTPAHITVDGRPISKGRVYKGWGGETAVFLDNMGNPDVYVPDLGDVISCDPTLFHDYVLFGRLEKGGDGYLCMSSQKEEISLDLKRTPNVLSFNRSISGHMERVIVQR